MIWFSSSHFLGNVHWKQHADLTFQGKFSPGIGLKDFPWRNVFYHLRNGMVVGILVIYQQLFHYTNYTTCIEIKLVLFLTSHSILPCIRRISVCTSVPYSLWKIPLLRMLLSLFVQLISLYPIIVICWCGIKYSHSLSMPNDHKKEIACNNRYSWQPALSRLLLCLLFDSVCSKRCQNLWTSLYLSFFFFFFIFLNSL